MKLRKILIICAIMVALTAFLAIYANAEAVEVLMGTDYFASLTVTEDNERYNERPDILETLFDGDPYDEGIYDTAHGWWGGIDDCITIEFKEPTLITNMVMHLVGNWTLALVEFLDVNGNVIYFNDDNHANSAWSSAPMTFFLAEDESQYLEVSKIKITVKELKWNGYQRTYKISEIEIRGMHEHEYNTYDSLVTPPTCAVEGQSKYLCFCGDAALFPVEPTGNHIERPMVVYRNGFTNPGYKATVCINCDTRDSNITDEIGPLFSTLGYSVREDGKSGIQLGFSPIYENIELFNSLTESGIPLQFGTISGSREVLKEGDPMQLDGLGVAAVCDGIIAKDYTSLGFDTISCKISGFSSDFNNTELFLSAYVYDGYHIYYLAADTTANITTVTYNGLLGIVPEPDASVDVQG